MAAYPETKPDLLEPLILGPAPRRNDVDCFRCGRKGHYTRDCWARVPGPPQQEASSTDAPRKEPPRQTDRP
ncbi:unnamed protein product [Lampetra planeri]